MTGAFGQIGSELVPALREKFGVENVIAMGHMTNKGIDIGEGPAVFGDVVRKDDLEKIVRKNDIDTMYHLAAILSAKGEQNPQVAYEVNMTGTYNILEIGREFQLERIMIPSSMAAYGSDAPKKNTSNDAVLHPSTMYGVTKVAGELLGNYYFHKYGLDVRGVRYPGILSSKTPPTAGTTDYATAIFYDGIAKGSYECFLKKDTTLPMMYMPDAIRALMNLADAPIAKLKRHTDYNVAAMSFSPEQLAKEVQKHIPNLTVTYKPDYHQPIADSWPASLDDSPARKDWGWKPEFGLSAMVKDLFNELSVRLGKTKK